ncbi:hypothetical protein [Rugamonas aquatica]|uniref:Uncharacterized protein n=1 Tax=Rugamonas aquatica TaxID=2743357 RepID=A0A6A7N6Z6_9BURK|nr:hypothetical protein [Rugamonas aquatica]MQA40648.1 hypothetical protein [Rugamonas aquatica]
MAVTPHSGPHGEKTVARADRPPPPSLALYLAGALLSQLALLPLWTGVLLLWDDHSLRVLQDPFGEFSKYFEAMAYVVLNDPTAVAAYFVGQWLLPPFSIALVLFVVLWARALGKYALRGY